VADRRPRCGRAHPNGAPAPSDPGFTLDEFVDFEVITTSSAGGEGLSVAVRGELDLANCERLKPALDEAVFARRPLILNLNDCSFIDSSGLRLVIQVAQDLAGEGEDGAVPMAVIAAESSAVRKMLTLTAIDLRIPVFETHDEATGWLEGGLKPDES
jgi:anti-anti-sigma factor